MIIIMWRGASLSFRLSTMNALIPKHRLRSSMNTNHRNLLRYLSSQITEEDIENSPLRAVFESIERQSMEADQLRALTHPTPWFNLLRYPGRAAWRSSDHLFDTKSSKSPLSQTQFNLIQHSGRTNKQLKRTYKRIMETHRALAIKRERERRMAANLTTSQHLLTNEGGKLEDPKGRNVGSWKVRSDALITCDDPSVSFLLSGSTKIHHDVDVESGSTQKNTTTDEVNAMYRSKRRSQIISSAATSPSGVSDDKSVGYGPEQVITNLRYRFGPNYSIVRRVLLEVQSLLGGTPKTTKHARCFKPKRVLDFGSGVGSASAAALDVFGVSRTKTDNHDGIEWIHSIDTSQSMRDATENVLTSILEGAPWGYQESNQSNEEEEELEDYERLLNEIKGGTNERVLERKRKRMLKWEQSWEAQNDYRTRLTFGESIVDSSSFYSQLSSQSKEEQRQYPDLPWQKQLNEQRKRAREKKQVTTKQKGSFDLILCTYTLSELNSVSSTLTAAALLWEKLGPGGIMVFVEPGTPDGFSTLRSVRSMLLECSPPQELRNLRKAEEKRRLLEQIDFEEDETARELLRTTFKELESRTDDWEEECQVIAPCTHNGLCPMSRHQKNHIKRNTRFGKYEMTSDDNIVGTTDLMDTTSNDVITDFRSETDNSLTEKEEEEELMQELIEQGLDRDQLEEMMRLMESLQDNETSDDSDNELEEEEDEPDEEDFLQMDGNSTDKPHVKSTMAETDAFGSAFCSFVQNFPGGTTRKKGEKFSYLVVQKQTPASNIDGLLDNDALTDIDIVDILAKSAYHVQGLKQELVRMAKRERNSKVDDQESFDNLNEKSIHAEQLRQILEKAVQIEDKFLDSSRDTLGMELVHGDKRRKGWGRLVRAPIKKKGHILVDYCSAGCSGCNRPIDGTQGRIIRQKVSRGWSSRVAPGCYAAARKSRWGGLWPDLSERIP